MNRPSPHRGSAGLIVLALLLSTAIVGTTPASAGWQTTSSAPDFALLAGRLSAPAQPRCSNRGTIGDLYVRLSWPRVTGATSYELVTLNGASPTPIRNSAVADSTAVDGMVSIDVRGTLLSGVFSLLSGDPVVAVVAVNGEWRSDPSAGTTLLPSLISLGVIGALRCS